MVTYDDFKRIGTGIFTAGKIITAEIEGIESRTFGAYLFSFAAADLLSGTGGGTLRQNRQGTYSLL
jgi:hypothetical protein